MCGSRSFGIPHTSLLQSARLHRSLCARCFLVSWNASTGPKFSDFGPVGIPQLDKYTLLVTRQAWGRNVCISPNLIWVQRGPKYEQQPVACRQCWRCKKNRVNDYVARAMAESSVSEVCCTISLTYAPRSDLADKVLHPRHFQLFMKLLRRAGHRVRYLVAGEYGDLKGRAHFHAILFFQELQALPEGKAVPAYNPDHLFDPDSSAPFCREIPQKRMVHIREWPHGHITCDWSASEKSARYVCKYLLSDDKNNAWFSLSKKPTLGSAWFAQKAAKAKEFAVLPSSFNYLPPGGDRGKSYLMTGATRRDYLNAITTDPALRGRMSEWVQKTFDKHHAARIIADLEAQPLAVLQEAFEANKQMADEQQRMQSMFRYLAERDTMDELLAQSETGMIRKHEGQWADV